MSNQDLNARLERIERKSKQYRVSWLRNGWLLEKTKVYRVKFYADRFVKLLGPEPWTAFGKNPDDYACCSGSECACGGQTVREDCESRYGGLPKLESVRIEVREVAFGPWSTVK